MSNFIRVIYLQVDWASQAYCNFTIFVAVIMFVISLGQFVRFLKFFYKGRDSSFLSAFVDVIVCVFMCAMTLTAALFVTLGFKIWCEVCKYGDMKVKLGWKTRTIILPDSYFYLYYDFLFIYRK